MLKLENISKTYLSKNSEKVQAISNFSYCFEDQGLYLLSGKSGSGKTTLAKIIALYENFDSGTVTFNQIHYQNLSISERDIFRTNNICLITQEENVIDYLNVYDNIKVCFDLFKKKIVKKDIYLLLETFKLTQVAKKMPSQISGGEKQRLSIMRKIILPYKILIFDEPTCFLDLENKKILYSILNNLRKETLIIMISHDYSDFKNYFDEIIVLENGCIVQNEKEKSSLEYESLSLSINLEDKKSTLKTYFSLVFKKIKMNISSFCFTSTINFIVMIVLLLFSSIVMYDLFSYQYAVVQKRDNYIELSPYNLNLENFEERTKDYPLEEKVFSLDFTIPFLGGQECIELDDFEKEKNHLIYGKKPENYQEILISKSTADNILKSSVSSSIVFRNYQEILDCNFKSIYGNDLKISGIFQNDKFRFYNYSYLAKTGFYQHHLAKENVTTIKPKTSGQNIGLKYLFRNESIPFSIDKIKSYDKLKNNEKVFWVKDSQNSLGKNEALISYSYFETHVGQMKNKIESETEKFIKSYVDANFKNLEEKITEILQVKYPDIGEYYDYIMKEKINLVDSKNNYSDFYDQAIHKILIEQNSDLFSKVYFNKELENESIILKEYNIVGIVSGDYNKLVLSNQDYEEMLNNNEIPKSVIENIYYTFESFEEFEKGYHAFIGNDSFRNDGKIQRNMDAALSSFERIRDDLMILISVFLSLFLIIFLWKEVYHFLKDKNRYKVYQITGLRKYEVLLLNFLENNIIFLTNIFLYFIFFYPSYLLVKKYFDGTYHAVISLDFLSFASVIIVPFIFYVLFIFITMFPLWLKGLKK